MADPRFFSVVGPFSLGHLAEVAGAELSDKASTEKMVCDVAPLSTAQGDQISFWDNKLYIEAFAQSGAGACLVRPDVEAPTDKMILLRMADPYRGYARIAREFYPVQQLSPGISESSNVDKTATIGGGSQIDAGAVISAHCVIGEQTHIGTNAVICDGVEIGSDCLIGPSVTVQACEIGNRVIIHSGVRIGQDGFGFALGQKGHLKVPQLGRVIIEDDVEIGANSTIDRGAGPDTVIGQGTKIDNLVQIAHNVTIGRNCIIVSQVGISGSTKIGDVVMLGGQAGLTGHLTIGDGAQVAAQGGVIRDVAPGQKVGGTPAVPMRQWLKSVALMEKLLKTNKKRS
jgi:UDP-3-O-[3-hydroxymyristoyl] glucosamine N-acyltransferase